MSPRTKKKFEFDTKLSENSKIQKILHSLPDKSPLNLLLQFLRYNLYNLILAELLVLNIKGLHHQFEKI